MNHPGRAGRDQPARDGRPGAVAHRVAAGRRRPAACRLRARFRSAAAWATSSARSSSSGSSGRSRASTRAPRCWRRRGARPRRRDMAERIRYVARRRARTSRGRAGHGRRSSFTPRSITSTGSDALLAAVRARPRAPRGVLYLDEYVGPARDEWTWRHLLALERRVPVSAGGRAPDEDHPAADQRRGPHRGSRLLGHPGGRRRSTCA